MPRRLPRSPGAAARPGWCWSARRRSGCCTGRTAGSPNRRSRCTRSSPASGATMTPTSDIPAAHPSGLHVAEFDQRVREWRQRFLRTTAQAVGAQVAGLGWHRILLVGEPRVTGPFRQQLPEPASGQVIATDRREPDLGRPCRGRRTPGRRPARRWPSAGAGPRRRDGPGALSQAVRRRSAGRR